MAFVHRLVSADSVAASMVSSDRNSPTPIDPHHHVLLVGLTHPGEASCDDTRSLPESLVGAGRVVVGSPAAAVVDVAWTHLAAESTKADDGDDSKRKDDQADGGRGRTTGDERDEQQVSGGDGQYQGGRVGSGVTKGGVSRTVEGPPP